MKLNVILSLVLVVLTSLETFASECADDAQIDAARNSKLVGRVLLQSLDSNNAVIGEENDSVIAYDRGSDEYKYIAETLVKRNLEQISDIFALMNEGEAFVVARDHATCEVVVFGTDGEDSSIGEVLELTETSLTTVIKGGGRKTRISKAAR